MRPGRNHPERDNHGQVELSCVADRHSTSSRYSIRRTVLIILLSDANNFCAAASRTQRLAEERRGI